MDTGRADYNAAIKVSSIPEDAPTFLLKPTDAVAVDTVRAWAAFATIAGAPPAVIEQALVQADRMERWPGEKKVPGDDHLEPHQKLQLAAQHQRRLWDGGTGAPWRLAELRGHVSPHQPELLRQLAMEQQGAAELYLKKAAGFYAEAGSRKADGETRTAAWFAGQRREADDAANRAAYFLAIATALHRAATILEAADSAGETPAAPAPKQLQPAVRP